TLRAIVGKNICKRWRKDAAKPVIRDCPNRMLARRTASKVLPSDQNTCASILLLIEDEGWIRRAVSLPPIVKKKLAKAGSLDALQKLLRNDLVRIDVCAKKRRYDAFMYTKGLHRLTKLPFSDIGEMSDDRRCRCHHRTYQVSSTSAPLPAFEV